MLKQKTGARQKGASAQRAHRSRRALLITEQGPDP